MHPKAFGAESARQRVLIAVSLVAITAASYWGFPGHSYLRSDTQIYAAILEHLRAPAVLARDPIAVRPHVSFTAYDEVARTLRGLTGLDFETVLAGQAFVFRLASVAGVFWLASAMALTTGPALLLTSLWSLGATVVGPAVLTVELEPVPRAAAVCLVLLALGLIARGSPGWGSIAGAAALLYHPPTAAVFWLVYLLTDLFSSRRLSCLVRSSGPRALAVAVCLLGLSAAVSRGLSSISSSSRAFHRIWSLSSGCAPPTTGSLNGRWPGAGSTRCCSWLCPSLGGACGHRLAPRSDLSC